VDLFKFIFNKMADTKGNTGIDNTGENNSGNWNSGYRNSGDWNSGNWNSGYRNSGDWNSGYRNSGDWNSGYWNSGYRNSGDWNSGYRNSGYRNSGDWNSGDWNSGYRNSGNWNSGDWNSGYMNSDKPTVRMFNKDTGLSYDVLEEQDLIPNYFYFDNNDWISTEDMTDEEKAEYPEHTTTGGYIKVLDYYQAWRRSWDKASDEDRRKTLDLPNFNAEIFKEITGIDIEEELGKTNTKELTLEEIAEKFNIPVDKLRIKKEE
jgi:hypothetical protein